MAFTRSATLKRPSLQLGGEATISDDKSTNKTEPVKEAETPPVESYTQFLGRWIPLKGIKYNKEVQRALKSTVNHPSGETYVIYRKSQPPEYFEFPSELYIQDSSIMIEGITTNIESINETSLDGLEKIKDISNWHRLIWTPGHTDDEPEGASYYQLKCDHINPFDDYSNQPETELLYIRDIGDDYLLCWYRTFITNKEVDYPRGCPWENSDVEVVKYYWLKHKG